MPAQLKTGDPLPPLMAKSLDGDEIDLIARVAGNWAVIMFYRGDW